jgi:hypothetical protein
MRRERRNLIGDELRAIAAILTPEQREKARDYREDRVVVIGVEIDPANPPTVEELRETIADRLQAAADELGLTADQREKIRQSHAGSAEKYQAQRDARRALRARSSRSSAVLTPSSDQVKDAVEACRAGPVDLGHGNDLRSRHGTEKLHRADEWGGHLPASFRFAAILGEGPSVLRGATTASVGCRWGLSARKPRRATPT